MTAASCWLLLAAIQLPAAAQSPLRLGSTAYLDYFYNLTSPDEGGEGLDGFTYRRLYLTADYRLSEHFSARARLEAGESVVGDKGPVPFVKDLYLRWRGGEGHTLTVGVAPPPVYDLAEDLWGYRGLEKTLLDLFGVVSSRDFGVRAHGPLFAGGAVQYALMYANNSGTRPETNDGKRYYSQIILRPSERVTATLGANYASYEDPHGRDDELVASAMAAYVTSRARVGFEAFWNRLSLDAAVAGGGEGVRSGVSLWAVGRLAEDWELVARVDRAELGLGDSAERATHVLGGLSYRANEWVRVVPNLQYLTEDEESEDPLLRARMTFVMNI